MRITPIDERTIRTESTGRDFVLFVYEGGDSEASSWSVDSLLLSQTDLPEVLAWLPGHLPEGTCWSLGVVAEAASLDVIWLVGADVLNIAPADRTEDEEALAQEMLARRNGLPGG